MEEITLTKPDDWHVHFRDKEIMKAVVPETSRYFARAIVMPNLIPPIQSGCQATDYKSKIEKDLNNYLLNINDNETYFEALAERSLLKTLDGSCRSPISASAYIIENDRLKLYGAIARLDGTKVVKSEIVGLKKDAVLLGKNLGTEILSKANGEIIYK